MLATCVGGDDSECPTPAPWIRSAATTRHMRRLLKPIFSAYHSQPPSCPSSLLSGVKLSSLLGHPVSASEAYYSLLMILLCRRTIWTILCSIWRLIGLGKYKHDLSYLTFLTFMYYCVAYNCCFKWINYYLDLLIGRFVCYQDPWNSKLIHEFSREETVYLILQVIWIQRYFSN